MEQNKGQNQHSKQSSLLLIWDFLKIILLGVIIVIPLRYYVFQTFVVSGSSMEPNFSHRQYLIIDELSYHLNDPERGQVVVFRYPRNPKEYFIKRIIGLPNEKIKVDSGRVTIYNDTHPKGLIINEPYLPNQNLSNPHDNSIVGGEKILTLGPDEYFVMGDNRMSSSDSRDWGPLPSDDLIGRVFIRVLPFSEFGIFHQVPAY